MVQFRSLSLGLSLLGALVVSGCVGTESSKPVSGDGGKDSETKLKVGIVFDKGGLGDKSFNDSAWRGVERAQKELGIELLKVESKSDSDYESNVRTMAEEGSQLVIAVGLGMDQAVSAVAPDFPDTKFAIVDGDAKGDNVLNLKFKEEEGSFLVGYLAGLMTKSGKVGFVGGMEIPLIKKFEAGYHAGVATANPNAAMVPVKYVGSWDDVDKGKANASVLFAEGADIVYHAAGRTGLGVIRAAKDSGNFAIGVDSDQDDIEPGTVLTSMVKRVDEAVFKTIQQVKDGKFEAGATLYSLKDNGVGTSELRFTKDKIGAEKLAKLEEVKAKIVAGEIVVPASVGELDTYLKALKAGS